MPRTPNGGNVFLLLLLAATALLLHGYHLGVEDQAIYLPAIKQHLDPTLYPYDAVFFSTQTSVTLFDELIAFSVPITHLPVDVTVFFWQLLTIFLVLLGCWQLSRRCFAETAAQWAAVGMFCALLTLPVAGTALNLMDEHLHPRGLATAALLFAFVAVLDQRPVALVWVLLAGLMQPTMALFGAFHLAFQAWRPRPERLALLLPPILAWEPTNQAWREVLYSRDFYFPLHWAWYELLGAFAPLALLAWFARIGRRSGAPVLEHVSQRLAVSGSLGVAGGILFSVLPGFERLVPLETMRTLHLVYLIMVLLGGGLIGRYLLRNHSWRWIVFFGPVCAVMFYAQLHIFPASPHIEWPGRVPKNAWVKAFDWIRRNTPRDTLFALDPHHMERPGEDFHGFRAFAERGMLADWVKDRAVTVYSPGLAHAWQQQVRVRARWKDFGPDDFRRLKQQYGVTWVVLERPGVSGLSCPYTNDAVMVCRVE